MFSSSNAFKLNITKKSSSNTIFEKKFFTSLTTHQIVNIIKVVFFGTDDGVCYSLHSARNSSLSWIPSTISMNFLLDDELSISLSISSSKKVSLPNLIV